MADTRTHRVLIIAEAGVNHDGNIEQALRLVDVAADAGADLVKFQTFDANALATANAELAAYQEQASECENQSRTGQLAMLQQMPVLIWLNFRPLTPMRWLPLMPAWRRIRKKRQTPRTEPMPLANWQC